MRNSPGDILVSPLLSRLSRVCFFLLLLPSISDIQFWNSRQSLEGLSVRSIIFGVFQSLVVLLYILDNETNFVVQVSVFIGLLIDFWKITKVMDVKVGS